VSTYIIAETVLWGGFDSCCMEGIEIWGKNLGGVANHPFLDKDERTFFNIL